MPRLSWMPCAWQPEALFSGECGSTTPPESTGKLLCNTGQLTQALPSSLLTSPQLPKKALPTDCFCLFLKQKVRTALSNVKKEASDIPGQKM